MLSPSREEQEFSFSADHTDLSSFKLHPTSLLLVSQRPASPAFAQKAPVSRFSYWATAIAAMKCQVAKSWRLRLTSCTSVQQKRDKPNICVACLTFAPGSKGCAPGSKGCVQSQNKKSFMRCQVASPLAAGTLSPCNEAYHTFCSLHMQSRIKC